MASHKGITCDVCLKENFAGVRYKCLICQNYDMCALCYNEHRVSLQHTTDHAVQTILTQSDFELYFGTEAVRSERHYQSYTCPCCGQLGFTDTQLREHILSEHSDSTSVICPLCTILKGGSVSFVENLSTHIAMSHPDSSMDHNVPSASNARVARLRAQQAHRHGVWTSIHAHSRRGEYAIHSSNAQESVLHLGEREDRNYLEPADILSQLSHLNGRLAADEILSLELQLLDAHRRSAPHTFEHLLNNEELRSFYDPLLIPLTSAEPSAASSQISAQSEAETKCPEKKSTESSYLLMQLQEEKTAVEKETWEVQEADRSVFLQGLLLAAIGQPLDDGSLPNVIDAHSRYSSDLCHNHDVESTLESLQVIASVQGMPLQSSSEIVHNNIASIETSTSFFRLSPDGNTVTAVQQNMPARCSPPPNASSSSPSSCDRVI